MSNYRLRIVIAIAAIGMIVTTACERRLDGDDDRGPSIVTDTLDIPADARILSAVPNIAFGSTNTLEVGTVVYTGGPTYVIRTLVALPSLPDSIAPHMIERATLVLRYTGDDQDLPFSIVAHRITEPWYEDSVTWIQAPGFDSAAEAVGKVEGGRLSLDVRAVYLDTLAFGVMLTTIGTEQEFHSREAVEPTDRPILVVALRIAN